MSLSRSDPTDHWGNNSYTAAFLPKAELQDQMKLSLIMLCRTDISMSWRSLDFARKHLICCILLLLVCLFLSSFNIPAKQPKSKCLCYIYAATHWAHTVHKLASTRSSLLPHLFFTQHWDFWLWCMKSMRLRLQGLCIVQVPIFTAAKSWQAILKELLLLTNQLMRLKN